MIPSFLGESFMYKANHFWLRACLNTKNSGCLWKTCSPSISNCAFIQDCNAAFSIFSPSFMNFFIIRKKILWKQWIEPKYPKNRQSNASCLSARLLEKNKQQRKKLTTSSKTRVSCEFSLFHVELFIPFRLVYP